VAAGALGGKLRPLVYRPDIPPAQAGWGMFWLYRFQYVFFTSRMIRKIVVKTNSKTC
jgi:hypothetical protein